MMCVADGERDEQRAALDLLVRTADAWGLRLEPVQVDQFACYLAALQAWNERVNLTAITGTFEIVTRHFLDSLYCALCWGSVPQCLLDIGTGGGFPGLPLKIVYPEIQLTLVESIAKKVAFLQHVVTMLQVEGVEVIPARAEAIGQMPQYRERYDVVTARAVAELRVLVEYCLPLCRVGGRFFAPKGALIAGECEAASHAIGVLGGRIDGVVPVMVPGVEQRTLVVVEKVVSTPMQYPRAVGVPAKRPL